MSRTFFIRINLDDMCADLDTLRPDQQVEWLAGFRAGSRGRIPAGWDGPRLMGAEFGMACYQSAEEYRSKQSDKGRRSAEARKAKAGTADPRANREPDVNRGSTVVGTVLEPAVNLSNIQYPISNIQKPVASSAAAPRQETEREQNEKRDDQSPFHESESKDQKHVPPPDRWRPLMGVAMTSLKDKDRTEELRAEWCVLIDQYTAPVVDAACRKLYAKTNEKAWPADASLAIRAEIADAKAAKLTPPILKPAEHVLALARANIAKRKSHV